MYSLRDGEFTCFYFSGISYELSNLILNFVSHAAESLCFLFWQTSGTIGVDDIPVVIGVALVASAFVVAANIVVDAAYAFLDPRVRVS